MQIKELVKQLSIYPEDTEVLLSTCENGYMYKELEDVFPLAVQNEDYDGDNTRRDLLTNDVTYRDYKLKDNEFLAAVIYPVRHNSYPNKKDDRKEKLDAYIKSLSAEEQDMLREIMVDGR